jgi:KDEL-tailed cysteine endopeptidase
MRVVLAALALFSSVAAHAFTDCAASPAAERLHVQAVTLLPDPIVSGQTLKVQMHGANAGSAEVASGSAKLTAQVFGITVATLSFDLCTQLGVACPLASNASFTAQLAYPIPGGAPPGVPITATIHVLDGAQVELTCIKMELAIAPPHLALLNASSMVATDAATDDAEWLRTLFDAWLAQFNVSMGQAEYVPRLRVFAENHARIAAHNTGGATWRMAHNQFSHLTQPEFVATHLAPITPRRPYTLRRPAAAFQGGLPASVDWVAKGAVTPVKNQEQCGSCWAFSATGALEGAHFVKSGGSLVSLSEQMLVDCDTTDSGCGGGSMDSAFDWAAQAGGLCAESAYAYTGHAGSCAAAKCARVPGSAPASHVDVEPTDAALMAAVAAQPVAVAIEADQSGFQFYSSGVFSGACGTQLDHGVLLVGYGTSAAGVAYYKVKNSWGAAWGQQGYVLLQRGGGHEGGMCGILTSASYPVL